MNQNTGLIRLHYITTYYSNIPNGPSPICSMIRRLILDKTGPYSAYSIYSGDEPLMDPLSIPSMRITKSPKPATSARRGGVSCLFPHTNHRLWWGDCEVHDRHHHFITISSSSESSESSSSAAAWSAWSARSCALSSKCQISCACYPGAPETWPLRRNAGHRGALNSCQPN